MKLVTFEVRTHVGRVRRLGAWRDGRVIDLNFACAAMLAREGEPQPQRLADAFVPASMREFLEGEGAAMRRAREALEAFTEGCGPNDETLAYAPHEARLRGGLPVIELFFLAGLAVSNSEARRLVRGGGARLNDAPVAEETAVVDLTALRDGHIKLSAGRKRHVLVRPG